MVPDTFFRNTVVLTALAFYVLYFNLFHFTEEIGSKNEIIQTLIGRCKNIVFAAFPFFMPFINVDNFFSDTHYRVHVMGIDEGGHIVLTGNVHSRSVLDAVEPGASEGLDEFSMVGELARVTKTSCPPQLADLRDKPVRFRDVCDRDSMEKAVFRLLGI